MDYTKQNFQDGEVLTAAQLNHIEDGIDQLYEEIADLKASGIIVVQNGNTLTIEGE